MCRRYRYIPVQKLARELEPSKAMPLPAFHALSDYDTTSALFGKDKKTAWPKWQPLLELSLPLQLLSRDVITRPTVLERLITQLYGVQEITSVDGAILSLFLHKGRYLEHMSQSIDALHQQILRVAYQSGHT